MILWRHKWQCVSFTAERLFVGLVVTFWYTIVSVALHVSRGYHYNTHVNRYDTGGEYRQNSPHGEG